MMTALTNLTTTPSSAYNCDDYYAKYDYFYKLDDYSKFDYKYDCGKYGGCFDGDCPYKLDDDFKLGI